MPPPPASKEVLSRLQNAVFGRPIFLAASTHPGEDEIIPLRGSLYMTRQTLFSHITSRERTQAMADDLFAVVEAGQVKIRIDQRYPLAEAATAHRELEARKTTGSTILTL